MKLLHDEGNGYFYDNSNNEMDVEERLTPEENEFFEIVWFYHSIFFSHTHISFRKYGKNSSKKKERMAQE